MGGVISDSQTHAKSIIVAASLLPSAAALDPQLILGLPPHITAATGMDALTHAIEAYVSTAADPITDACAIKAIELIRDHLREAVHNGSNMEARKKWPTLNS